MKGQIYSLIVIVLVIPLLIFIITYITFIEKTNTEIIDKIVADQIHQTEKIISNDFDKAITTAGKRAILSLINIIINGSNITNPEVFMVELMTNGSYNGTSEPIMFGNTIEDWKNKILTVGINFNKSLSYSNVTSSADDEFDILTSLQYSVSVVDRTNRSRIEKNDTKNVLISIEGFDDPLFLIKTSGFSNRKIKIYPYSYYALKVFAGTTTENCTGNVSFTGPADSEKIFVTTDSTSVSGWKGVISENSVIPSVSCYMLGVPNAVSILQSLINSEEYEKIYLDETTGVWSLPIEEYIKNGYYSSFVISGPSFFRRMEGNISATTDGIQSIVRKDDIPSGSPFEGRTEQVSVDYLFFDSATHTGYPVRILDDDIPSLRLDCTQAANYNLTELVQTTC